ncbi:DUF3999 family protein [Aquimarina sp. M1]
MEQYKYKRSLSGISDTWHTLELPNEIFNDVSYDFSDIRVFGITKENDTVEAPYLLKQNKPIRTSKKVNFETINRSITARGSFVTYKVPMDQTINQIRLFFQEDNFDQLISLEGSQNLEEWFTIVDNYRVLSIKNELTSYNFTTINFPSAKYRYYRVFIKGNNAPEVKNAQVTLQGIQEGSYHTYTVKSIQVKNQKQLKNTIVDIDLPLPVPVSYIRIEATNDFDYYRPMRIEYLHDSLQNANGWRYDYRNIASSVLTSFEKNEFHFQSTITNALRLTIDNQDNEQLDVETIEVKGFSHELIMRFTTPADYFLTYGNSNVNKPSYDIQYMTETVPRVLKKLKLGAVENISKTPVKVVKPLFENKIWLWAVMLLIIILLGGFTFMMMKNK